MNVKSIPTRPKSVLPTGQAAFSNYMNRMFLSSILGFLAFFGIACGLGSLHTTSSVPSSSAFHAAASVRA
ncbi:MAG: hypothetical protein WCD18_23410 [Thermosynechococcaceae cyanobacterium]